MIAYALYHWAPQPRRPQIIRHGLRPSMPSTTDTQWRAPYVCFAETPSWAWGLSGAMRTEIPVWDLWQTSLDRLVNPDLRPSYDEHRWHEVRTAHPIQPQDLWYVATRQNPPTLSEESET